MKPEHDCGVDNLTRWTAQVLAAHYEVQLGVVYPQLLGALCAGDDGGSPLGDVEQLSQPPLTTREFKTSSAARC